MRHYERPQHVNGRSNIYIWRKLDKLWKDKNNRVKDKVNICNADVRSKIAYSLETAPLNAGHKKKLDAFQQKKV